MFKNLKYFFAVTSILFLPLASFAEGDAKPEIQAQGEMLGEQISLVVEYEGVAQTYILTERARQFHLRPDGSISSGSSTRCDPYLGQLKDDITIRVNITERYIQGEYVEGTGWQRTPIGHTGEESLTFKKGSRVVGRCQGGGFGPPPVNADGSPHLLTSVSITPPRESGQ